MHCIKYYSLIYAATLVRGIIQNICKVLTSLCPIAVEQLVFLSFIVKTFYFPQYRLILTSEFFHPLAVNNLNE